ncbi:MAG: UbiA family prenyltransferase [Promethearchaeota archaeon]
MLTLFSTLRKLIRPFTLIYPAIAILAGSIIAYNSSNINNFPSFLLKTIFGIIIVCFLNSSSNIINQIYDIEIDRINKPNRPLPRGEISKHIAAIIAIGFVIFSLSFAFLLSFPFFFICLIALLCTLGYSTPPIRLKRFPWLANLIIAIPRGLLLIVAGWAIHTSINIIEPWLFGSILFFFFLGATTAKDFTDIKGDKINGIITIPIKYGVEKSIKVIKPFFIFPFFLIGFYCFFGWLNWIYIPLILFAIPGYKAIKLIENEPEKLAIESNHPSWKIMYFMVIFYALSIIFLSYFAR